LVAGVAGETGPNSQQKVAKGTKPKIEDRTSNIEQCKKLQFPSSRWERGERRGKSGGAEGEVSSF